MMEETQAAARPELWGVSPLNIKLKFRSCRSSECGKLGRSDCKHYTWLLLCLGFSSFWQIPERVF